ncbi:hypothetical protein JCGZ_11867 [Jatropha curcas]|uniref:FBD domain-containing protein n=1 Tax=Jatropha curcas TaxID=180498 RepID=A0A067LNB6_JATCU|nr:hypothetical protein JCGZ_11867 [Jatropha curcas]
MSKPCRLQKINNSSLPDKDINDTTREDFISQLPDEVLSFILSKLTLKESVGTSILSHRWRHVSASPSILVFDWLNMFCVAQNHQTEHSCRMNEEKFVRGVNQYLDFYKDICLHSFKVSFCIGHGFTSDIDRWVSFAIRMGVQTLSLELYCKASCVYRTIDMLGQETERKYVLQSSLLEGAKANLKHLDLVACRLERNFTTQFSFLETLTLAYSPLAKYDLQSMFSYMANLRHLMFDACMLPVKLSLGSLLLLKRFYLKRCVGIKEIELSNVNLLYFQCIGREVITYNLSGVPNLIELKISVKSRRIFDIFTTVPESLPLLKGLAVYTRSNWVKHVPESITVFRNVLLLKLVLARDIDFDILKMISILRAFPHLMQFCLVASSSKDKQGKLQLSEYIFKHLKHVNLSGFSGTPNQIEFAKYLLKNALILEELVINPKANFLVEKRPSWDEGEGKMVTQTLQEFYKEINANCRMSIH